jgi:hypothetical protein
MAQIARAGKAAIAGLCVALACASASNAATLKHFRSEADLARFLERLKHHDVNPEFGVYNASPVTAVSSPQVKYEGTANGETLLNNLPASTTSITNNQEAAVDEGDIVKLRGATLVVLRRGRLFTISLADGGLRPVDAINAYPPGVDARDDWYDEMLIAGDRIVVIGYSYARGGTEINRFRIDGDGHLAFQDAYQVRSDDYYSSRNYASRLIGHTLILYSPQYVGRRDPFAALPALRRWNKDAQHAAFERIGSARRFFLPPGLKDEEITALHTVEFCDVTAEILKCDATSLFGPEGRNFYVSPRAVYIWMERYWSGCWQGKETPCLVYRVPLDGGAPSALSVRGSPTDQFSFHEDGAKHELDVLVRSWGGGEGMWGAEDTDGSVTLVQIPLASFGDGLRELDRRAYRRLPAPKDAYSDFNNRFVGGYVLYGTGNDWDEPKDARGKLIVARVQGDSWTRFDLPHGVDRIEAMGPNAVVAGSDSDRVYFSSVLLGADGPVLGDSYVLKGAAQSETRSHGFFFKPDAGDGTSGVIGLPIGRPAQPAYRQLFDESAAVLFLRYGGGRFSGLGELASHPESAADDKCVTSCVDWYGNARPIFVFDRTIALMGYELVEGSIADGALRERARTSFAPH